MSATGTATSPARWPARSRRVSTMGYWVAAVLILAGLVLGAVWGVASYARDFGDRIASFPRTTVPGTLRVEVEEPSTQVVYVEEAGSLSFRELDIAVIDPRGVEVAVRPFRGDLLYEASGEEGRLGRAVATFWAGTPGGYRVDISGDLPAGATVAVGENVVTSFFRAQLWPFLLVVATVTAGVGLLVTTAVRRSRVPMWSGEVSRRG